MTIRNVLATSILLALLSACDTPYADMKSPCVGAEGSPCERHPVNDWWLKQDDQS